jgi:hypothetical protein
VNDGQEREAGQHAASRHEPDETAGDVVEGGRGPRLKFPRGLVIAIYVACGVAVVVWGIAVLVDGDRGTVAEPTPPSTVAGKGPDASPSPDLVLRCGGRDRELPACNVGPGNHQSDPGRHSVTVGGIPLSFRLPSHPSSESGDAWTRYNGNYISQSSVGSQEAEAVIYWTGIVGDRGGTRTCGQWWGRPGSLAAYAAHAATMRGTTLVSFSNVTLGGVAAKQVVLRVRKDLGCDPGYFYHWKYVPGGPFWSDTGVGDTIRVWLVDVPGTRLFIAGETKKDAGPKLTRELQRIIHSIRFD